MSATTGNYSESLYRNSEGTPCRLCMKKNDYYYNIFTSIVARQITVEDALYDLVDLKVAVGDGLPATLCPLCLKKLIKFYDFRNICHESDAELRKFSSRNNFRSFEGEGAADDNSGSTVETKGCIQDAIENNSQPTCSAQTTEIYLPVPDSVLPRVNELFPVKEETEDQLSKGNYPPLYASDPAGISTDASNPLASDDLSDPVTYKCSSVKNDEISDDEEGYVVNDCTGGTSTKQLHQDSSNQPITLTASQGGKVEGEDTGAMVVDLEGMLIGAKKEPPLEENDQSIQWDETADENLGTPADTKDFIQEEIQGNSHLTCSVQTTEIYIPMSDSLQLRDNMLESPLLV